MTTRSHGDVIRGLGDHHIEALALSFARLNAELLALVLFRWAASRRWQA